MTRFLWAALAALIAISGPAKAEGLYVGAYGGANWDDVLSATGVSDNTGYLIGATLGTQVKAIPGLRIEADISFRQNDVDIDWGYPIKVAHNTFALMGNAVYDAPFSLGPIHPYLLAGVGYGHTEAIFEDVSILKLESSGLAYQLGGGINTSLADGVTLGVGYRYLKTEPLEVLAHELSDGSSHSLIAELRFAL